MSASVARALRELGKSVVHVGGPNQPTKGTDDSGVAAFAHRWKRLVFTQNFDMVIAAAGQGVRFIWYDGRGGTMTKMETALLLLTRWDEWERTLSDPSVDCIQCTKRGTECLDFEEARRRAQVRMERSARARAKAAKVKYAKRQLPLAFDLDDEG